MSGSAGGAPEDLEVAVTSVARAIADSLELREVWGRVADACRAVVPFDAMGVSRFEPGDVVRVYVTAGDPAAHLEESVFSRAEFSPGLQPESMAPLLLEDVQRQMDPAYRLDQRMIERGYRALLRLPLHQGEELVVVSAALIVVTTRALQKVGG